MRVQSFHLQVLLQSILRLFFPQDLILQMVKLKNFIINSLPNNGKQILDAGDILVLLLRLHKFIKRLMFRTPAFLYILHQFYQLNEDIDD